MSSDNTENKVKVNAPTDKEYTEIIKSEVEVEKKYIENEGEAAKIMYYCRECKKPVSPVKINNKLTFKCAECEKNPISFGTENSVTSYYNIK